MLGILWRLCLFFSASPFVLQAYVTAKIDVGQLGNQCFQIAAAVSLALDHGTDVCFPELRTSPNNGIPDNYAHVFWRLNGEPLEPPSGPIYEEKEFPYVPIPYEPNLCLKGYFQSEKYFRHHKQEIQELFAPSPEITRYLQEKYGDLLSSPHVVALHIRTYVKDDPRHRGFCLNGLSYIKKAIALFPESTLFLVFSDHMSWCKKKLKEIDRSFVFIEGQPHYYDFYLMSMCPHQIISNSSFSWWAAYLNPNPHKIVVAPKRWFQPITGLDTRDIAPPEWIVIP